jgi:hypothetical protein
MQVTTNPAEFINSGCKRRLTRELQQAYLSNKVEIMANPLPLPGPLPANERRHVTFAALYADQMADPCQGNYQRIMDCLDPETNQLVTPLLLFKQAVGAGPIPQAYLCFALQHNQV